MPRGASLQIGRRYHDGVAEGRPQRDRDHVLLQLPAEPDAGVIPLLNDVDDGRVADQLDLHVGVATHEVEDQRAQDVINRRAGSIDPQGAGRRLAQPVQIGDRRSDVAERRGEPLVEPRPRLGGGDAARGPVQETQTEPALERGDALAQSG